MPFADCRAPSRIPQRCASLTPNTISADPIRPVAADCGTVTRGFSSGSRSACCSPRFPAAISRGLLFWVHPPVQPPARSDRTPRFSSSSIRLPLPSSLRTSPPGLLTRLSLLDSQGNLLIQSDGASATDPGDMIDLNVGAETDYLELQSLAGTGTYTLTTELTDSSQPDAPVAVGGTVGSVPAVVTGSLGTTSAVVGTIQNTPLAADPGDGTEDVFTVNQGGDILWRKGDSQAPGSFSAPVTINPGDPSRAIAFVPTQSNDLLASVDLQDNAVSLYAYNGGQFVWVNSLATGALPTQIVAGDLTGSGNTDLVVLDARDGAAAVYLGDGIGGFARGNDVPVGLGPRTSPWLTLTGRGASTSSSPTRLRVSSPSFRAQATPRSTHRLRIQRGLVRIRSMSPPGIRPASLRTRPRPESPSARSRKAQHPVSRPSTPARTRSRSSAGWAPGRLRTPYHSSPPHPPQSFGPATLPAMA